MTQIFVPAILVELLNSEVDATRQLLNQEIMEEKGMHFLSILSPKIYKIYTLHIILLHFIPLLKKIVSFSPSSLIYNIFIKVVEKSS